MRRSAPCERVSRLPIRTPDDFSPLNDAPRGADPADGVMTRRWVRRVVCAGLFALVGVWFALTSQSALAIQLGNFTLNHYSRVELAGDSVRVRYVLDLAEIPSVQETRAADTNADGVVSPAEWDAYKQRKIAEISRQLELTIDNQIVQLQPTD